MFKTAPAGPKNKPRRKRRSILRLALGLCVVIATPLLFALMTVRVQLPHSVLTASHALPAGHRISAEDLRAVDAQAPGAILAVHAERVLNRTTALPLAATQLITEAVLGEPVYPPPGQGLVGVAVKPGQFPQRLTPGTSVTVIIAPDPATDAPAVPPVQAVVAEVTVPTSPQQPTLIDLLMTSANAQLVTSAAAEGRVSLVQVGS